MSCMKENEDAFMLSILPGMKQSPRLIKQESKTQESVHPVCYCLCKRREGQSLYINLLHQVFLVLLLGTW